MRLDKYLKVSRLNKRRTVANDACDAARITVNGKPAKASYQVKIGDVIEIAFGQRTMKVEVLDIAEHTLKADASRCIKNCKPNITYPALAYIAERDTFLQSGGELYGTGGTKP